MRRCGACCSPGRGGGSAPVRTCATGPGEALGLGLVNPIVPHEDLMPQTRGLPSQLAAGPTRGYGLTKRAINYGPDAALDEARAYEAHLQDVAGRTADHREGVAAFLG